MLACCHRKHNIIPNFLYAHLGSITRYFCDTLRYFVLVKIKVNFDWDCSKTPVFCQSQNFKFSSYFTYDFF